MILLTGMLRPGASYFNVLPSEVPFVPAPAQLENA